MRNGIFIGGRWQPADRAGGIPVINPATEQPIATIARGTAADVDRAVTAAQQAFESWSTADAEVRAKALAQVADGLRERRDELLAAIVADLGAPAKMSRWAQVDFGIRDLEEAVNAIGAVEWTRIDRNSTVTREPVGVVGAITPWNFPLHQITTKLAGALAAGCTVVVKPSELAPLASLILAEVIEASDIPPGVVNMVHGYGSDVGEAISAHPGIDMVSFTGSTDTGRRIAASAARTVKKVALELGGKSPAVLLESAPFGKAVPDVLAKCFINSGQSCTALTRMVVPRGRLAEVEELVAATIGKFIVGDPADPATRLGPVISEAQRDRIRGFVRKGQADGLRLLAGGADAPPGLDRGYFVRPTVFSDVPAGHALAQQEIFGPVLSITTYDSVDDAVRIANGTPYGLGGAVWGDPPAADAVAARIRSGQIEINGGVFNPGAPFGGFKQSGVGREAGRAGIEEYLETKSIQR